MPKTHRVSVVWLGKHEDPVQWSREGILMALGTLILVHQVLAKYGWSQDGPVPYLPLDPS